MDIISPDKLVIHSRVYNNQSKESNHGISSYHAEIELPNEPIDLDAVKAEFNISKKILRVYTI